MAKTALEQSIEADFKKGQAEAYRIIGSVYLDQAKYLESEEALLKSIGYYSEDDCEELLLAYSSLGTLYSQQNDNSKALEHFYKGLEIAKSSKNENYIARLYFNLGNFYLNTKDTIKSREYYCKAYKIYKKNESEMDLAHIYNSMAVLKHLLSDTSMSFAYFKKTYKIWEKHNHKRGMLIVANNLARLLVEQGDHVQSIKYIEKQIALSIELDNNYSLFLAYTNLGSIYTGLNQLNKANSYFKDAQQLAKYSKIGSTYKRYLKEVTKYYVATGDYQEAYKTSQELLEYQKQDFEDQINERMKTIKTNMLVKEKEEQSNLYRQRNEELAQLISEIEAQKEHLDKTNTELLQLNETRNTIFATISHDLRNYIGAISTITEMFKLENTDEKYNSYIDAIQQSSANALKLLKELLEVSILESHEFKLDRSIVPVNDLFQSFMSLVEIPAHKKNIEIELILATDNINANIDTSRFWQAISNIIFNAIKFTHCQGKIIISVNREDKLFKVVIKDNGIGIKAEMIDHIFDKFTFAKRRGTDGEATIGLGLYMSKKLIEMHQGSIEVESEVGKGTIFTILMPCAEDK